MRCEEVSQLSRADRDALFRGRPNLWGSHGLKTHLECQPPTRRFLLRGELSHEGGIDPDAVLCHVGVGEAHARIVSPLLPEGTRYSRVESVWGIGGVVTRDGQEGKGYASTLLTYVLKQLDPVTHPYAILYCLDHRADFYARRGWNAVAGPSTVEHPASPTGKVLVEPPYHVKYVPLRAGLPVLSEIHLRSRPW